MRPGNAPGCRIAAAAVKISTVLALALLSAVSTAQGHSHWLATRAGSADTVVLSQLERVGYEYERDFPVAGEAWLRPLITYKSRSPLEDLLVVREQGLGENECYFPRMAPWDERPRYLLFLIEHPEDKTFKGHPDGCAIEILVTASGSYAARWPQPAFGGEHGRGDEVLESLVEEMTFQGPMARIDASDMLAHQRRQRAEREFMRLEGTTLIPTRGVELSELRNVMRPGLETETAGAGARGRLRQLRERMLESGDESSASDERRSRPRLQRTRR